MLIAGVYTQRQMNSVAKFMSANRSAGRYLLCIAMGEMMGGATALVARCEIFAHSGFAFTWWAAMSAMVSILLKISGFVTYRYRETRAMTLAQFFEIRYNKSFRIFTGLLGFFAGMLNFGVIPAIGTRAMVYLFGFPETVQVLSLTLPTYVPLMALFISITLFVALSGGLITVLVINAFEGIMSQLFYLIIIVVLLSMFSWSQMSTVLTARPPGHSLVNPFDTGSVTDFNLWYVLMGIFSSIYATMAWQNSGAYNSAGVTPHENRMGHILSMLNSLGRDTIMVLLALCALTYLHHSAFAAGAAQVHTIVSRIANPQEQEQMIMPIAVACLLPVGIKSLFCVTLLMGIFGDNAMHMHSWGSLFVQDFLVPLRKKPFGPKLHLFILRCSIIGVGCFAFLFGTFFHLSDYINMWWSVTTAIFTGGAGSAIIGGLYWKKGTAAGAWAAFLTGSLLSMSGIITQQLYANHGMKFILNGVQIAFFSCLISGLVYVVTSLLTSKEDFNLERMLHREKYARIITQVGDQPIKPQGKVGWSKWIGFDGNFTRGDKIIAGSILGWTLFWFIVFVIGSIWNLIWPWPTSAWVSYYHVVGFGLPIFFAVATGIWFTWGGVKDLRDLFRRLTSGKVNSLDDGTVVDHRNLDEAD